MCGGSGAGGSAGGVGFFFCSAKAALDAAAALQEQPEVKAALEAGELSMAQA